MLVRRSSSAFVMFRVLFATLTFSIQIVGELAGDDTTLVSSESSEDLEEVKTDWEAEKERIANEDITNGKRSTHQAATKCSGTI